MRWILEHFIYQCLINSIQALRLPSSHIHIGYLKADFSFDLFKDYNLFLNFDAGAEALRFVETLQFDIALRKS